MNSKKKVSLVFGIILIFLSLVLLFSGVNLLWWDSIAEQDASGYYLTDSKNNLTKWKFPDGTSITGKGYLIIWADGDTTQSGLHTNYKLSSLGEKVILLTPALETIDKVEYNAQSSELAYARVPNGTGDFTWQTATFNYKND